jgi:hypothetical protein
LHFACAKTFSTAFSTPWADLANLPDTIITEQLSAWNRMAVEKLRIFVQPFGKLE